VLRLLIVRHGETDWNASGRYQGQLDTALNPAGRQQARAVARRLAAEEIHAIYSSDLRRAFDTAAAIAEPHPVDAIPEPRLREVHWGVWQGMTRAQIETQDAERLATWAKDRVNLQAPNGESLAQVADRVQGVLDEIRARHPDETVVLVAHGGVVRLVACLLLDHPLSHYWQFEVDNTAIGEIEVQGRGVVLTRWNDTHHLAGGHRQSVF